MRTLWLCISGDWRHWLRAPASRSKFWWYLTSSSAESFWCAATLPKILRRALPARRTLVQLLVNMFVNEGVVERAW
jgi:hypothetical protein